MATKCTNPQAVQDTFDEALLSALPTNILLKVVKVSMQALRNNHLTPIVRIQQADTFQPAAAPIALVWATAVILEDLNMLKSVAVLFITAHSHMISMMMYIHIIIVVIQNERSRTWQTRKKSVRFLGRQPRVAYLNLKAHPYIVLKIHIISFFFCKMLMREALVACLTKP